MTASATLREKLPSALAAIALQVGLVALLALSFEAVRWMGVEKETILVLPPLAAPKMPASMVIDARGRHASQPALAAVPHGGEALSGAPAQAGVAPTPSPPLQADCVPQGQARPAYRPACPPPTPAAKADPDEIPLHPDNHVKDEGHWSEEWAHEHSEYMPGVEAGPHDVHITLYRNDGPSLLGGYRTPEPYVTHAHSSDADVQKAMDAYHARMRTLYPTKDR